MSGHRYNRPKGPVPDYTPKVSKKEVEPTIDKQPCLVCKKMCHAYGRHEAGQSCSSKCEALYTKPEGERNVEMVNSFNGRIFVPD